MAHICAVKGVPITGNQMLALAEFYLSDPLRTEPLILRAAQIAKTKGVIVDGGELLEIAKFIL